VRIRVPATTGPEAAVVVVVVVVVVVAVDAGSGGVLATAFVAGASPAGRSEFVITLFDFPTVARRVASAAATSVNDCPCSVVDKPTAASRTVASSVRVIDMLFGVSAFLRLPTGSYCTDRRGLAGFVRMPTMTNRYNLGQRASNRRPQVIEAEMGLDAGRDAGSLFRLV
jgi:hypothetical protein